MNRNYYSFIFYVLVILILVFFLVKTISTKKLNENNDIPLLSNNSFIRDINDTKFFYELIPNVEVKYDGNCIRLSRITTIKINSDGFRDREFSVKKSNDTYRIITLGDSFTFGAGVELNETYPKVLERKLNPLDNRINYEVLNFGVPRFEMTREVELYKIKGSKYNPDMIIIGYIGDEIIQWEKIWRLVQSKETGMELTLSNVMNKKTDIKIWEESTNEVYKGIFSKPLSYVWYYVENPLKNLNTIIKENKTIILIYVFNTTPENQYESLKNITDHFGWYILKDNISRYSIDQLIIEDGHPNTLWNELVADQIFNYLIDNRLIPY